MGSRTLPLLLLAVTLATVAGLARPAPAQPQPQPKPPQPPPARTAPLVIERVVAVVNDVIVLESELEQRVRPLLSELEKIEDPRERQRQLRGLRRQLLEEMVDEELVLQSALEAKLEVADAEVDKALDEVKKQNKVTDEQLAEALALQGYTMPQYRRDVRRQILRLRAVNVLVRPRVAVTDDEVREYYDKLIGKSSSVSEVRVQHILVRLPERPSAEDLARARRATGELVARARAGEDFAGLAKSSSDDEATKTAGGELGWFKRGELPTEWEEVLFSMGDGEVRGPIRGPQGLHVFRLAESRKEATRPFDEVKEQIRNQIYNEELERQTKVWLEELRKKAHVDIKL